MSPKVKSLLEIMFHTGTLNPNHKMSAESMHEELLKRTRQGELEEDELPKISTIAHWINRTYADWKKKWQKKVYVLRI
jgi:DNA-directed RNA polymerase subunit H (RpoH/RPB5)